jgi:transcriptional regulator GlxA family with amidase domain
VNRRFAIPIFPGLSLMALSAVIEPLRDANAPSGGEFHNRPVGDAIMHEIYFMH